MSTWQGHLTDRAVSRRRGRGAVSLAALLGAAIAVASVLLFTACASPSKKPPALAPQTVTSVGSPEQVAPTEPERPSEPPPRPSSAIEKTIVIDPGGETDDRPSLVEAAQAEKERRARSEGATLVINDENLESQATGQLTIASPAPRSEPEIHRTATPEEAPAADAPEAEDYWREKILEVRRAWREVADEIDELEAEVNLLRLRFYEEDDPYYRDSQIKPAWDRALDRLRAARLLADEAEVLVISTLEAGRRAGALPGWMREGIELEPIPGARSEAKAKRMEEYEPGDPQIYDPDDDGGDRR